MIRRAEAKDKTEVSKLHYMASPNVQKYMWAADEVTVLKLLDRLYDTADTIPSKDLFHVYEEDGAIKGALSTIPGRDYYRCGNNIYRYTCDILRIAGPVSIVKMALRNSLSNYLPAVGEDELYIQAMAVFPEHRHQGVASAMLKNAFDRAGQLGLSKVSLLAETLNEGAIAMYKKNGFDIVATVFFKPKYRQYNLYGVHKMVAEAMSDVPGIARYRD